MKPKNPPDLTAERLRELLSYDPETGVFRRLISTSSNAMAGDIAGGMNAGGYVRIGIDGISHRAHRLAWLYMHGEWPDAQVDHRNRVRSDTRFDNLRKATNAQNQQNRGMARTNTSGRIGVHWSVRVGKWRARIRLSGCRRELGFFDDIADAAAAYAEAKAKMHSFQPTLRLAPQPKDAP